MKTTDEIQRAHDTLLSVVLGEVKIGLPQEVLRDAQNNASVLCWVLEHEHNQTFQTNLDMLREAISAAGYRQEKHDKLTTYKELQRRRKKP